MMNDLWEGVNTPNALYNTRQPVRKMIGTLYEGTQTMRDAGTDYLPQFELESTSAYDRRVGQTFLTNMVRRTTESFVGRVFKKDPIIKVPAYMQEHLEDIDMEGSEAPVFFQKVVKMALRDGHTFLLVDHTKAPTEEDLGRPVTRADEVAASTRPFLRHILAEQVIDWSYEVVDGTTRLTMARIRETAWVNDGPWVKKEVERIRILTPGQYTVLQFEEDTAKQGKAGEWVLVDQGETPGMPYVPLVPVYSNQTAFMDSEPILTDLSWKNIEHWQSSSDQRNILHVARVPILALFGDDPDDGGGTKEVSARGFWSFSDPQGDMKFVEHSGAAIGAGREDLLQIEAEMLSYGLQMMSQDTNVSRTATEIQSQNEAQLSQLGAAAVQAQDGLANALHLMAYWINASVLLSDITVELNSNVGVYIVDQGVVNTLLETYKLNAITLESFLQQLQAAGAITDELDVEREAELVKEQEPPAPPPGPPAPFQEEDDEDEEGEDEDDEDEDDKDE